MIKYWYLLLGIAALLGCEEPPKVVYHKPYDGPLGVLKNINTIYTDHAEELIVVKAAEQLEYQSGNREFPRGIEIIFYQDGKPSSRMTANKAYYTKSTNLYKGVGNVVVKSLTNDDKLESEELNWNPTTKKVTTDKFVRIENKDEILTGDGLEA
ncbi:MAG TPA: LPS export ABC transporter periplasmic protein LptC, partial [Cytophagales bacterium]|nr:LPS export ABC transporter periplasmic protein LptC [Cytophagales bacterium]